MQFPATETREMRILQVCSARSIGGGERHVIDLSNRLTVRGHEVSLALVNDSPLVTQLSDIPPQRILTVPLRNALDVPSAIRIGRFVRSGGIQIINAHLARDYPVAALAAKIAGVPFVITRHVLFPMSGLHRLLLRGVSFVIAPSKAVAESLRRESIFTPDKIVTIRYGLDVESFVESERDMDLIPRVGAIGNLDPVKGFDVLIGAAALVNKIHPSVRFEIVGEDRSEDGRTRRELEGRIAELELGNVVRLSGWSANVREKLKSFDLFVSSSRSESFGFVIAEAMLSGLPVVATETAGAREIISDLPLGVLVPIGSDEALATAILEILGDEMKRRQLAKFGRRHIKENFSLERMVNETEALYKRVIAG